MYTVVRRETRCPDGHYDWVRYDGPRHSTEPTYYLPYHKYKDTYTMQAACGVEAYAALTKTDYFNEWYSYTNEQRTTIRRQTLFADSGRQTLNTNHNLVDFARMVYGPTHALTQYVEQDMMKPNTQENTMNEFAHERNALENDLRASYRNHEKKLREHFHLDAIIPTTKRQVIDLITNGHYVKPGKAEDHEAELDRTHHGENALYYFEFREHPADRDGHSKAYKKLDTEYTAQRLRVQVKEPKESLKEVEAFRTATFH